MLLMQFSTAWNVWFQVLLYGGKVVSWKNERKEELLFMSSKVNKHCSVPFSLPKSMVVFLCARCFPLFKANALHQCYYFNKICVSRWYYHYSQVFLINENISEIYSTKINERGIKIESIFIWMLKTFIGILKVKTKK